MKTEESYLRYERDQEEEAGRTQFTLVPIFEGPVPGQVNPKVWA